MHISFVCLFTLLTISLYQCETPPCKTNCTTNEECWQEALTYRSAELIDQLFSFSSLAVHVDAFQRHHSHELNDSILFLDEALEDQLSNELINSSLSRNFFAETTQMLIESCRNLTEEPIENIGELPPLMCSSFTCSSETMNFMVILIISVLITSIILLLCILESFQTHRQMKPLKRIHHTISFVNPFAESTSTINFNSHRF